MASMLVADEISTSIVFAPISMEVRWLVYVMLTVIIESVIHELSNNIPP